MSKYKELLESIFFESDFVDYLKATYGTTDKMEDGGLVLPNGELIHVFNDGIGSHYDKVGSYDNSNIDDSGDFDYRADNFDEEILDNNIVRYSLRHTFQPDYIKLPSLQLTDEQKSTVQELIRHCSEKGISVMLDGQLGFASVKATQDDNLNDILLAIKRFYDDEYNALIAESDEYKSKKIFDKDSGYNISIDEDYYYDLLKKKWPDVERSKTFDDFRNPENNRPWQVDFYVPSEKMMIQINKNWKHGRRPYDPKDPSCQADVEWLKSNKGEYYDKVLYTWTELEPLKRKIAKERGYKYVEIFNMDEFNDWYKNPELTYEEYKHPTSLQYDSDEYFDQKAKHRDIYGNDSDYLG